MGSASTPKPSDPVEASGAAAPELVEVPGEAEPAAAPAAGEPRDHAEAEAAAAPADKASPAQAEAARSAEPPAESGSRPATAASVEAASAEVGSAAVPSPSPEAFQPTEAALAGEADEWTQRVLDDRYRIVRKLGEGGMGAVFVAEHLSLHKAVALKVVRAELAGNGEVAARFAREAMATAQFEHPHVASAIDYGTLPEGGAYFVMQLVRGRSLRGLLAKQKMPWRRVAELAAQVADALSAAKAAGIIHRDLKPDNILVERREDGSDLVKVLDFGIAHVAPREAAAPAGAQPERALTRVGTVMGTPGYMAPEQAVGDKVDHRADLYALGVVIWECIAGRELWDGPDLTTVVTRQMTEPVPKLRELVADPSLPLELDELVQRLTARVASERPEHAAEVRDTLRRLAHARGIQLDLNAARASVARVRTGLRGALARYRAQARLIQILQAAVAAAALALFAVMWNASGAGSKPAPAVTPVPAREGEAPPKENMLSQVVQAATRVVAPVLDKKPPPPKPALPPELVKDAETVVEGKNARERRAAAEHILAYKPEDKVFPHLRLIASLETTRGCKPRKELIAKMKEDGDLRYLPTLRRLDRSPRSGCGFLSLADCIACIRSDLREAVDALEAAQVKAETSRE